MREKLLSQVRKEKKLTQKELARLIGVVPSAICMYESGERKPTPNIAKRIAEALGFPDEWYKLLEPTESA